MSAAAAASIIAAAEGNEFIMLVTAGIRRGGGGGGARVQSVHREEQEEGVRGGAYQMVWDVKSGHQVLCDRGELLAEHPDGFRHLLSSRGRQEALLTRRT